MIKLTFYTITTSEQTLANTENAVLHQGATLTYDLDIGLSEDSKALVATVKGGHIPEIISVFPNRLKIFSG